MPKTPKMLTKGAMRATLALIKKYRSITAKTILKKLAEGDSVITHFHNLNKLTGFGRTDTCSLCKAAGKNSNNVLLGLTFPNCANCIHGVDSRLGKHLLNNPCVTKQKSRPSYEAIERAIGAIRDYSLHNIVMDLETKNKKINVYIKAINKRADYLEKEVAKYNKKRGII